MNIVNQEFKMGKSYSSCTSSIDSSSYPPLCSPNDKNADDTRRELSTDLKLGLSISPPNYASTSSKHREQRPDWPPIKPHLRNTLAEKAADIRQHASLFVKVYMEGIPIGRKLDLFEHKGYRGLITTLIDMFKTTIHCPNAADIHHDMQNVLTYQDKEGDWMMVGDVPWELFLTSVKRLKIIRADRC